MSVIVAHPKEGTVIADRFILEASNIREGLINADVKLEDKIIITDDNYFAYVFEDNQHPEFVPVILSYIQRFENKTLKEEENVPRFKDLEEDFGMIIVTKRNFYRYISGNEKTPLQIRKVFWSNHIQQINVCAGIDLPAKTIWDIILNKVNVYRSRTPQIFHQKYLTLIPVTKSRKVKKDDNNAVSR